MSWISSSRLLLRSSLWTSRSISIQVQNCRYISTPSFFGFSPSKKIQCLPFSPLIQPSQQQHNFSVSPISQNKKEWNLDDLKDDVKFDDLNNLLSGLPDGKEWFMEQGNYRVAKFYDEEAFPTRRVRYPIPNKEGEKRLIQLNWDDSQVLLYHECPTKDTEVWVPKEGDCYVFENPNSDSTSILVRPISLRSEILLSLKKLSWPVDPSYHFEVNEEIIQKVEEEERFRWFVKEKRAREHITATQLTRILS